jgi:hypothetical protein
MDEERVVNLKSGGTIPKIREGQDVFQSDSVVMKWNTFNGGDTAPSKAYMPMKSNDDTKIENPAVAPKIATDDDSKVL